MEWSASPRACQIIGPWNKNDKIISLEIVKDCCSRDTKPEHPFDQQNLVVAPIGIFWKSLDEGTCPTDFENDETWVSWGPGGKQDAILATWEKSITAIRVVYFEYTLSDQSTFKAISNIIWFHFNC